ncbi:MAG: CBS domain-containing protein [Pseudomonadota bacterium]
MNRDESILDAARLMREQHVGDVVVVEQREGTPVPVGILSDRDIVIEVLAKEVSPDSVSVGDIMSTQLLIARETDEILDTIKSMRTGGVRRMPVVDETGALVGILALDDFIELIAEQLTDLVGLLSNEVRRERDLRSD